MTPSDDLAARVRAAAARVAALYATVREFEARYNGHLIARRILDHVPGGSWK